MKRIPFIILGFVFLVACGHKTMTSAIHYPSQKEAEVEFVSSLTAADTIAMLELTDKFMSLVKEGKVEMAVDMITVLSNGVVYKPSEDYYQELVERFRRMNVESFKLEKYYFTTEGNNDVCYVTESGLEENGTHRTMKITFNPLCVDKVWYLALKDGNQSSKFLPKDKQINDLAPAPEKLRLNTRPESE